MTGFWGVFHTPQMRCTAKQQTFRRRSKAHVKRASRIAKIGVRCFANVADIFGVGLNSAAINRFLSLKVIVNKTITSVSKAIE